MHTQWGKTNVDAVIQAVFVELSNLQNKTNARKPRNYLARDARMSGARNGAWPGITSFSY